MKNVAQFVGNDVNAVVVMPASYDAAAVTMADCQQDSQLTVCGHNESTVVSLAKHLSAGDVLVDDADLGHDDIAELETRLAKRGLRAKSTDQGLEIREA